MEIRQCTVTDRTLIVTHDLASYLCQLLKRGVIVAVVTAAGYENDVDKYAFRLSGRYELFQGQDIDGRRGNAATCCILAMTFPLHPVMEYGRRGWLTSTTVGS
jgi:IMP and pyridine-specific 5'-nucleotidase